MTPLWFGSDEPVSTSSMMGVSSAENSSINACCIVTLSPGTVGKAATIMTAAAINTTIASHTGTARRRNLEAAIARAQSGGGAREVGSEQLRAAIALW